MNRRKLHSWGTSMQNTHPGTSWNIHTQHSWHKDDGITNRILPHADDNGTNSLLFGNTRRVIDLFATDHVDLVRSTRIPDPVSDHCCVRIGLEQAIKPTNKPKAEHLTLLTFDRTDWDAVRLALLNAPLLEAIHGAQQVDIAWAVWDSLFRDTLCKHLAVREITIRAKNKRWMTSELYKLSRQKYRLFRIAKRVGTSGTWEDYKYWLNPCNAAFSKAKAEFLRKQQKNLESFADGSITWWRKAKSIARIYVPTENLPDPTTADGLTVSNELALKKPISSQNTSQHNAMDKTGMMMQVQHHSHNCLINRSSISRKSFQPPCIVTYGVFLRHLPMAKSTADRLITNRVHRECAPSISSSLAYLFNLSNSTNSSQWSGSTLLWYQSLSRDDRALTHPTTALSHFVTQLGRYLTPSCVTVFSHFCKKTKSLASISLAFCLSGPRPCSSHSLLNNG